MLVGRYDSAVDFGTTAGRHDVGKASTAELLWSGGKFCFNLGTTAVAIYGAGSGAVGAMLGPGGRWGGGRRG